MTNIKASKRVALYDCLETAVLVVSADLLCEHINEAMEQMLSISRKRAVGAAMDHLLPANPELVQHCQQVLQAGVNMVVRDVAIHIPHWQRSTRVDYSITPISLLALSNVDDEASKQKGGIGLLLEMHEVESRVRVYEGIEQAEQFDAAIAIVKGLSHEIKNPLAGIRGAAQLLQRSGLSPAYTEFTDIIVAEVDRLANLLNRMSTLNKAPHRALVDCHYLLEHCIKLAQSEFGAGLQFIGDYDTSLPEIEVDAEQLIQVLINIIKNAGQAMVANNKVEGSKVGKITLSTRVAYPDNSRYLMPGKGIQITVQDTGPGMSEDMRARAFLPMVTDKAEGTGLGLSIAQEIMHNHGGFIRADDVQAGAKFCLFLPIEANRK